MIVDSQQMIGGGGGSILSHHSIGSGGLVFNHQHHHQVYMEGELALLSCNVQTFSRAQISWFRRQHSAGLNQQAISLNNVDSEPIVSDYTKYVQLGNLLLINRVNRNDSGLYVCQVKNLMGEERLETELRVRGK